MRTVVVPVAALLLLLVLGTFVVDHLGLDIVVEDRNDLAAIVALIDFLILIFVHWVWCRLLLVNLHDMVLLLLHCGI